MFGKSIVADDDTQARDSKLTIEDMAGGTFTISNVSLQGEGKLHQSLI